MILRAIAFAAILAATLASAASALEGVFLGFDAARGMRLSFAPEGEGYRAAFTGRGKSAVAFEAAPFGPGAEADAVLGGRRYYIRFMPEAAGLRMVRIPYSDDGALLTRNAQTLLFLREGIAAPARPRRYIDPPTGPGGTIDPEAFVESYAFWPPEGVSYGYGMVRGRYRTLIRLHALVQTDILWKMCQSRAAPAELAEALRGQGADCADILGAVGAAMQAGAPFGRFKADVEAQKKALTLAIRCASDYRRSAPECRASGEAVARAAVSMETVGGVLSRYR